MLRCRRGSCPRGHRWTTATQRDHRQYVAGLGELSRSAGRGHRLPGAGGGPRASAVLPPMGEVGIPRRGEGLAHRDGRRGDGHPDKLTEPCQPHFVPRDAVMRGLAGLGAERTAEAHLRPARTRDFPQIGRRTLVTGKPNSRAGGRGAGSDAAAASHGDGRGPRAGRADAGTLTAGTERTVPPRRQGRCLGAGPGGQGARGDSAAAKPFGGLSVPSEVGAEAPRVAFPRKRSQPVCRCEELLGLRGQPGPGPSRAF